MASQTRLDPLVLDSRGQDDRGIPRLLWTHGHRILDHAPGLFGATEIRLVYHEDVGDFQDSRFDALDCIPGLRHHHQDDGVADARDLELRLPDPHGLHDHHLSTKCIEQMNRLSRGGGKPAQVTPSPHAADEHTLVQGMPGHPNPVAEDRAPGEGTAGIHGDHTHGLAGIPDHLNEAIHQRAFPSPRRAGHADQVGLARVRLQFGDQGGRLRVAILSQADGPGQRSNVAGSHGAGQTHPALNRSALPRTGRPLS